MTATSPLSSTALPRQRVLVVDDDHLVADTLNLIFQHAGYETQVAYSAAEGLAAARAFAPGLLLCDVTMPFVNGLRLAEDLHREQPACHTLMFSAYASNAIEVERQADRLQRPIKLITKPCRPELLLSEVDTLLKMA